MNRPVLASLLAVVSAVPVAAQWGSAPVAPPAEAGRARGPATARPDSPAPDVPPAAPGALPGVDNAVVKGAVEDWKHLHADLLTELRTLSASEDPDDQTRFIELRGKLMRSVAGPVFSAAGLEMPREGDAEGAQKMLRALTGQLGTFLGSTLGGGGAAVDAAGNPAGLGGTLGSSGGGTGDAAGLLGRGAGAMGGLLKGGADAMKGLLGGGPGGMEGVLSGPGGVGETLQKLLGGSGSAGGALGSGGGPSRDLPVAPAPAGLSDLRGDGPGSAKRPAMSLPSGLGGLDRLLKGLAPADPRDAARPAEEWGPPPAADW